MEKQKRWQFYVILAVILLTLYNILPTVFYYTKPLKEPINAQRADQVALEIVNRVDSLEEDAKEWLYSFCNMLRLKPASIELQKDDPRLISVAFNNAQDAAVFQRFLPRAGSLIPFVPSQLELNPGAPLANDHTVLVSRPISVHLDPKDVNKLFTFSWIDEKDGQIAPFYREVVYDRAAQLALALGGPSRNAMIVSAIVKSPEDPRLNDAAISLAQDIVDVDTAFRKDRLIAKRYFASFTQVSQPDDMIQKFVLRLESLKKSVDAQRESLAQENKRLKEQGLQLESSQEHLLAMQANQGKTLESAIAIIKKNMAEFKAGQKPLTQEGIENALQAGAAKAGAKEELQTLSLEGRNPYVQALLINWNADKILLKFYDDVQVIHQSQGSTEAAAYLQDRLNQYLFTDIARASQAADEHIVPDENTYAVHLNTLTDSKSILALNLGSVADQRSRDLFSQLTQNWSPKHPDLARDAYPIENYSTFKTLKPEDQKLGLVIYAPSMYNETPPEGFRPGSIYVIARGLDSIIQKYRETPNAASGEMLLQDINQLNTLLRQNGFIGYSGSSLNIAPEFSKDFIFELDDYYSNLIKATREDFQVKGSKRYAILDFTDVEQRILARNKIDDRIQEDLLKWKEEYNQAQVDINVTSRYQVPPPTKNAYWENFKLSFIKYFRGDDRKILKWGLDLSGGKTVRIGLRDRNNKPVTNMEDLKQAQNELYNRVNKMGVSERTIRIENDNIILDFPGSQNLSAAELVKASAMYFHIVNEKFTPRNPMLKEAVNQFLQNVWNEAVVTNRKDIDSINEIAWHHLGGENALEEFTRPRSEAAKLLFDNGLRLANPRTAPSSHAFNDTLSAIGILRGEDFAEWYGQSHPLIVIFHNYALEGSSLTNINVGYDATQGNNLSFTVKGHYEGSQGAGGNPREDLYAWTSHYAKDRITGTPLAEYSRDEGWRMAVILNGSIISMPTLQAALRDGGTISGHFSQREVNQLAADLKAGSLSFTPRILSEENVSPELGAEERMRGIVASLVALALVVVAMVGYYHFAGVVASCAVLFNILIMWGVLQNLGAALSLPSIAGIVLTIGMAVDANVLVFERIREEFSISGRIASAIQAGYKKAFSAIIDSNITTIIAAFILIQFDSGPIKGFALALIVGIVSSMFTALFVTRYFFAGWVQNPKHKSLSMSQFFKTTHFDFLGQTKKAVIISLLVILLGSFMFYAQRNTMFGMDFTGGYSLNVELQEEPGHPSYRMQTIDALEAAGLTANDFQVRELSRPNQLRIQLGMSMEQQGHPFYHMPEQTEGKTMYEYQRNPRIVWLVDALAKKGLTIQPNQLPNLDRNWTVMSGQFSESMRDNAIMALALALISILAYITIRFEFKYAVGAVVGLVHDVIITLGILALFQRMGFAVQIDLQVVGAIMTIIGYSLNDTIIVFDRIREDIKIMRKMPFNEIVNHALNVTLSRTVMTSGTTMLVLLALVLLGGQSIFAFSLVMTIGVVVGTLSSLYIAAPVMIYFHNREVRQQEQENHLTFKKA